MRHVVRPHDKDGRTKCLWEVAFHNGIKTHLKSKFKSYVRKKSINGINNVRPFFEFLTCLDHTEL